MKLKLSVGCGRSSLNEWVIQSFIQTIHPNSWFIWSLNHSLKWQNVDLSNEAQLSFFHANTEQFNLEFFYSYLMKLA